MLLFHVQNKVTKVIFVKHAHQQRQQVQVPGAQGWPGYYSGIQHGAGTLFALF